MVNCFKSANMSPVVMLLTSVNIVFSQNQGSNPNIIVILADDLGYSDPGCYGGELHTPALDRLAAEGVRLARFHNNAMCVCSRASLMTGKYYL